MKSPYIKSIFEQISIQVFQMKNLQEAQTFITEFVSSRGINEDDKKSILKAVNESKNIQSLQRYICNSLLKFEGLGTDQMKKTPRSTVVESGE
jgi:hypothetical protein